MVIKQVYVAGSYSAPFSHIVRQNIGAALAAAQKLGEAGYFPIVPHVSGSHRVVWNTAMERCARIIQAMDPKHDALVLLPNWENSAGAVVERTWAEELGLPVHELHELLPAQPVTVVPA